MNNLKWAGKSKEHAQNQQPVAHFGQKVAIPLKELSHRNAVEGVLHILGATCDGKNHEVNTIIFSQSSPWSHQYVHPQGPPKLLCFATTPLVVLHWRSSKYF